MNEGMAIIIAAIITTITTASGLILTFVLNLRHNERQRKEDSRERFFYEMYQKRLSLYEDIIKTITDMGRPEEKVMVMSPEKFFNKVLVDYYMLLSIIKRTRIFGSQEAVKILLEIKDKLLMLIQNDIKAAIGKTSDNIFVYIFERTRHLSVLTGRPLVSFIFFMEASLANFSRCIEAETGTDFIDSRVKEIFKAFTSNKINEQLKRESNAPIDEQNWGNEDGAGDEEPVNIKSNAGNTDKK
jgi:hypothetical protein